MRKLALVAVLAASAIAVALSSGSSHREAPGSSQDPTGDWTDVYFFTPQDDPGSVAVVANVIPFEDPAGGPLFYSLDPNARYYVNFDNTGDGRYDVRYRFEINDKIDKQTRLALGSCFSHSARNSSVLLALVPSSTLGNTVSASGTNSAQQARGS